MSSFTLREGELILEGLRELDECYSPDPEVAKLIIKIKKAMNESQETIVPSTTTVTDYYDVYLVEVPKHKGIATIVEIRKLKSSGLKETKDLVEAVVGGSPQLLLSRVPEKAAYKIRERFYNLADRRTFPVTLHPHKGHR